jgi:putative oxygen-independent coproporphyrinogen III oxidase
MSPVLTVPPLALYVHFPWCVRKCPYCDFNSFTLHGELPETAYVQRLLRDLAAQAPAVAGREVRSIFLGGGTPSLFSPEALGALLSGVRRELEVAADVEVTLEANPGAIERGAFRLYREAGINRVSLGAQSFDAPRLHALGRIHSPEETRRAAHELHQAGLGNFNLDLMYALPGQDLAGAAADLRAALALSPAHLSHYQLTLEPGTPFAALPPPLPDEDTAAAMLEECSALLAGAGFERYEVSGYARAGRRCRHNLNYWQFGDYLGIGAGAHGKLSFPGRGEIVRTVQPREPRRYLAAADGEFMRRTVPASELPFEYMLNALRLTQGFAAADFSARTGLALKDIAAPLAAAGERGLLEATDSGFKATPLGLSFLNELLVMFLPESAEKPAASALSIAEIRTFREPAPALFTAPGGPYGE